VSNSIARKKESIEALMSQANSEISKLNFANALPLLKKVVKDDFGNTEAIMKRATCYVNLGLPKMAIPDLVSLSRDFPLYDVKIYSMLGACMATCNDFGTAVKHISRGLSKFPSSLHLMLARGKMLLLDSKVKTALRDFKRVVEADQESGDAWEGIGDCFVTLRKLTQAAQVYKKASSLGCTSALLKRAELFYQEKHFPRALGEVDAFLSVLPTDSAAFLLKANILIALDQVSEAALCLEQSIKFDSSQEHFTSAILLLGKFNLKRHDYYGAFHTLQRAAGISSPEIDTLVTFTEAVMGLVRRNFQGSIEKFTKLIKEAPVVIKEFLYDCYANRAFANASCKHIRRSLKDVLKCAEAQPLDEVARYNSAILKGFVAAKDSLTEDALMHFEAASEVYPRNAEPLWYIGLVTAMMRDYSTAKECLNRAVSFKDQDCDILFSRALLHYLLDDPVAAIKDVEAAIDKSDDNEAAHYLLKGLSYGRMKLHNEARDEFSVCLQLCSDDPQVLFYRGRCSFLARDTQKAFDDFQMSLDARQDDPKAHSEVGDLLMSAGAYTQAAKAYEAALDLTPDADLERKQALCFFAMMDWDTASKDLRRLGPDADMEFDLSVIGLFMRSLESQKWEGCIAGCTKLLSQAPVKSMFTSRHIRWLKGTVFVLLNSLSKASTELQLALEASVDEEKGALLYNFAVISLMKAEYEQALSLFIDSFSHVEETAQGLILLLVGVTALQLEQGSEAKEYMTEAFRLIPKTVNKFLETSCIDAAPFQRADSCLDKFPDITISARGATLKLKLALPCPKPPVPPLEFQVDESVKSYLSFNTVKCKLEAPWLNRINGAVQFTDNLQDYPSLTVTSRNSSKASLDTPHQARSSMQISRGAKSPYNVDGLLTPLLDRKQQRGTAPTPDDVMSRIDAMCTPTLS
jgi:tetratricopeptide (TPR) repeat protein